jgi:3-methylcrotonyl-CoA carboxylase alpha subunit
MFSSLLIANRGEIACRIIRTARAMGLRTIAVHSDADAAARHVRMADEAHRLGPAPAGESYLRGDAILAIAKDRGAEAIHPGYGFLSENADFAEACARAGVTFVGPTPRAIRDMGLKDRAKAIAVEVGAPVLPGYWGEDQSDARLSEEAARIGFPLLVKAVAGGGGRGIRVVHGPGELSEALASARREAGAAFGDDRMMLERLVLRPRHLEVQVFGDAHGGLVHLFERDCSIQRRRQKLIEEAPAPGMTEAVREALTGAALKIARAVDYVNAGTVEFVADGTGPLKPDGFWFLEMNTRLQVEHPVTEAVTGFDLVEWQLRVAAGEPLPATQAEIRLTGAAVEARVVAEDPAKDFQPSSGLIEGADAAAEDGVRVDAGFEAGDVFPDAYDSLMEKVIAHGETRAQALDRLRDHLRRMAIVGVATNAGWLGRLIGLETFARGAVHTGLLDDEGAALAKADAADPRLSGLAAIATQFHRELEADPVRSPFGARDGWRGIGGQRLSALFALPGGPLEAVLSADETQLTARVAGVHTTVARRDLVAVSQGVGIATIALLDRDGATVVTFFCDADGVRLVEDGEVWTYPFPQPDAAAEALEGGRDVKAPLPGKIAVVNVAPGQSVRRGEVLMVLEAMKMEHGLPAPRDGVVEAVSATAGRQVKAGDLLAVLAEEG